MEPVFHIEDVVGSPPSPEALPDLKAALAELTGKVGWAAVKRSVAELLEVVQENYQRELRGEKLLGQGGGDQGPRLPGHPPPRFPVSALRVLVHTK